MVVSIALGLGVNLDLFPELGMVLIDQLVKSRSEHVSLTDDGIKVVSQLLEAIGLVFQEGDAHGGGFVVQFIKGFVQVVEDMLE